MRMFRACVILLLFLCNHALQAQGFSLDGRVQDRSSAKPLHRAVVMLMAADSTLYKFIRTGTDGSFSFPHIDSGRYTMVITFPKFADFVDTLHIRANMRYDSATLFAMADMLEKIEIFSRKAAIRMNGDTLEYQADSFRVHEGASVEDLLKKLPGVQVNRKGEIIAQGKKVDRVLVDGEEFFGDDPTMATKNLDAKNVDKLQVYDTKTDQAKATGTDDGQTLKVMDIRLKENAKKGFLGKLSAGSDGRKMYEGRALVSHFKGPRKMNAYGIAANSPNIGLNWDEKEQYGESERQQSEEGYYYSSNNDELQYWMNYSEGLPTSLNYGANFFNKYDSIKHSVGLGVNYKDLLLNAQRTTTTKTLLNENALNQISKDSNINFRNNITGKFKFESQIDSMRKFTAILSGKKTGLRTDSENSLNSFYDDGRPVNYQLKRTHIDGLQESATLNLAYSQKMKKKERYFSVTLITTPGQDNSTTDLVNENRLYSDSVNFTEQQLGQQKRAKGRSLRNSASFFYNEPLTKFWSLSFNTNGNHNINENSKYTFNRQTDGNLESNYVDSLSANTDFRATNYSQSANLTWKNKKWRVTAGLIANYQKLSQTEEIRNYVYSKPYFNWLPSFSMNYKYSKMGGINMNYSVQAQAPGAQQVQPIVDNSNPLYLLKGNPELRQAFYHNISASLNDNKILRQRYFYMYTSLRLAQDQIGNTSTLDSFGRSQSMYINTQGNWNFSHYMSYWKSIPKMPVSLNINYRPNVSRYISYFNGVENSTLSQVHVGGIGLDVDLGDIGGIEINFEHTQNISQASIQTGFNNNNWQQKITFGIDFDLPGNFTIGAEADMNRRQKTEVYQNNANNTIISARVGKRFLKSQKLSVEFGVHDLLNQNFGYNRNVYNNTITENQFNSFRRFFYGKISWRFNTAGPAVSKEED